MTKITVAETHPRSHISILYEIETIDHSGGLHWRPLMPREVKVDGKFVSYHKDFTPMTGCKSREYTNECVFSFKDEADAVKLAKAMSKIWDMPLRVMKVQRIRIQSQCGKILLPSGGV